MNKKYYPGMGCRCGAHSENECCCGVDWTDERVYQLREQNEIMRNAIINASRALQCDLLRETNPIEILENALVKVKLIGRQALNPTKER